MYSTELWGRGTVSVWFDLCWELDMSGLFFDGGPVYGGLFVSLVDVINLICLGV